jgi:hypothetical protein
MLLPLLFAPPLYLAMLLLRAVLYVVGWIVIPIVGYDYEKNTYFKPSPLHPDRMIRDWKSKWMYVWGNEEEGIEAGRNYKSFKSVWLQIIYWSARRNPTNNWRFVKYLTCPLVPEKIGWIGTLPKSRDIKFYDAGHLAFVYFCWCGPIYSNFRVQVKIFGKIYRFWVGWKIYPHDSRGLKPTDYRRLGAGFTIQGKPVDENENIELRIEDVGR